MSVAPLIETGMVVDDFTIGEVVHRGGMAVLWRCTHPEIPFPLLMKVPRLADGEDPAAIVSFEMEQMILPRLSGPHVPKTFGVGDFSSRPYIVVEEIAGETLLPKLKSLPLEAAEVATIGISLATALDSLHRQNVIHLDLKPSNILFRPSGEAVLIDYGLSHHTDLPDLMAEQFRLPYGTAPYMAPEQVLGVRNYRRSDIFALGVLMYFFATAVRPFGDPVSLKGLKERLWRDPIPPRRWRADIPAWLQEVILRCLEPNPEQRYPTAAQVAFDLKNPDQIVLTARRQRLHQDSWLTALRRKYSRDTYAPAQKLASQSKFAAAPIVLVALDPTTINGPLGRALRDKLQSTLAATPDARAVCMTVLNNNVGTLDQNPSVSSPNRHVARIVALKHWAKPLGLGEQAISYHVPEALNTAEAILEYARANHVDHIIMGARAESTMRNLLGSVSAQVSAHAPCSVTVVRRREWPVEQAKADE
ncbi:serine/threonine-protein kinase PknB [Candidatus Phycosocius bacilliformis]|uniref:Serine/threonine-protein kinase PknB n=1 Tax=Candidatus Phycosocius bacilliformis TaxID=1445552 RepID=A0A2P2ECN9_9PROT|nr:bifunctional serine/threonine-protein kinase/universal stress protein [Candidatus Phycosocius bacilliformis]GBF58835.1 serine/threonine-protein kinase PknB [Candidatus Phycosocius bacilliformis]